jgi:cysteine-rich repeat protein
LFGLLSGLSGCDVPEFPVQSHEDEDTSQDASIELGSERAVCGNDIVEDGEECDGSSGLSDGACLDDCTLDRSIYCPDGTISHRMPHDDSIWKENNTFLDNCEVITGACEVIETRTFCVDLALSGGESVYVQAVHQWGEEMRGPWEEYADGNSTAPTLNAPRPALMTLDVTPPPASAAIEKTAEGESPLIGFEAASPSSSGVWRIHLRDWSAPPIDKFGQPEPVGEDDFVREEVAYDILLQVVQEGAPFDVSQGVERTPVCGDGEIHLGSGEQCDDANSDEEDGCWSNCLIDTEKMCPAGVLDSVFDDPMDDNETSGLDNLHGIYGYEGYLDFVTETRVHCVPVPHDPAIKLLTLKAYEDCEAGVPGHLVVTPPAGSGIQGSLTGDSEAYIVSPRLYYGRVGGIGSLNFHNSQGGVWLHSLTGTGGWNGGHHYWEFKWIIE